MTERTYRITVKVAELVGSSQLVRFSRAQSFEIRMETGGLGEEFTRSLLAYLCRTVEDAAKDEATINEMVD